MIRVESGWANSAFKSQVSETTSGCSYFGTIAPKLASDAHKNSSKKFCNKHKKHMRTQSHYNTTSP